MPPRRSRAKAGLPVKRNPFLLGDQPLPFEMEEDALMALTDEQASEVFLSEWYTIVDPWSAYKRYLQDDRTPQEGDVVIHHVKQFYIRFVLDEDWSEEKYIMVLDSLFLGNRALTIANVEKQGPLYDAGRLPMQRVQQRAARRRL